MTHEEPKLTPTSRYDINATCLILGIHRNTLREYTDKGYIKCVTRDMGKRPKKYYTGLEIMRFWRAAI